MENQKQSSEVNTSIIRPMIVGLVAFLALFGLLGVWMAQANIAGAVIAPGVVVVKGQPKTIQHLDGGLVAEIHVSNGDLVSKNDLLMRLDDKLLLLNLKLYRGRIEEALARKVRLEAESSDQTELSWNLPDFEAMGIQLGKKIKQGQEQLFDLRHVTLKGQISGLHEKIEQNGNQIDGVMGLIHAKNYQVELIKVELEGLEKLYQKGNTTLTKLVNLKRQKANLVGQLSEHKAELARIGNVINENRIQILQLEREFRQGAQTELQEVRIEINTVIQQIFAAQEKLRRIEIRAPVSGIIHKLSVFTIGGVIAPSDEAMQIIPQKEGVDIHASIEPQFIDQLFEGQETTIRFTAFSRNETPEVEGRITKISPSSIQDEKSGHTFYKVVLELDDEQLAVLDGKKLVPGMPVEVFVRTRMRTALNYIFKPFLDQVNRAFRED